jgi:hypothetical protein
MAQPPREALQGGISHVQAALAKQLLHTRQLQMVLLQPGGDLLGVWR